MTPPATKAARRAFPAAAWLAAATLALGACSPSSKPQAAADAGAAASAANTLHIAFLRDNPILVSLDPFQVYWIEHRVVLRNVAESLTDQDPATGKVIPWLAKSWDISPDALQYTFKLRDGVSFSNGAPFNAQAVKTAFDTDKAFAATMPSTFGATYLKGYDHADVVDDHTIRIVLSHPNAGFLQATSTTNLAILAPQSYALTAKERSRGAIIGTGPFVITRYTPEVGIQLAKRKGYAWASGAARNPGEAHVDNIDITYIPEESVRNGKFIQGQLDIVWPRDPFTDAEIKQFTAAGATIQSRALPGPAANLYPNVSDGHILSDPRVRLALQKAIDRRGYATTIYNKDFPVVSSVYESTTPYFKPLDDKLAYDPAGAAKLLDQAGWVVGADGIRHQGARRLTLVRVLDAQSQTSGDALIQDQLRQVGIEVKARVLVMTELVAAVSAGKYDLALSYMTRGDPAVLQTVLDPRYANRAALAINAYAPETAAKAEKLFDDGTASVDDAKRAQAYAELQDLLIDEGVAFPVYERLWQAATGKRVQGFNWTAEGFAQLGDIQLTP